jgi:hypothetical protein
MTLGAGARALQSALRPRSTTAGAHAMSPWVATRSG